MRFDDDGPAFDDGSSSRYDDERNETLRSFAEQLCGDPRTIRYSEDEWIMLADYADDVDNFYLYSEAVIRGLQAYPDSVELADRHLMLLNRICRPDELCTAFEAAAGRPGASKIARLYDYFYQWSYRDEYSDAPNPEKLYNALRSIMLDGENLTDQEAIETVRVAADMGVLSLVVKDMDQWTAMMDYPETFRYELCATAFERCDVDSASSMAEILVENYPYNFRYWILKCRIELMRATDISDDKQSKALIDEAVNSVETAIAINPDNEEAVSLRQRIEAICANGGSLTSGSTAGVMFDENGNPIDIDAFLQATPPEMIITGMSVEMLVYIFDSHNDRALDVVSLWVKRELDACGDFDGNGVSRLLAYTVALYELDRVDDVDYILAAIKHSCKRQTDYDEYLLLELIRLIERSRLDDADRLMTRVERIYGIGDASVAILSAVLNQRRGRPARSENAYDLYRTACLDRLEDLTRPANGCDRANPDLFSTPFHDPTTIDMAVAHFVTRIALRRD